MAKKAVASEAERALRQAARSSYKMAETMKMARMAQEGTLVEYLVTKEVRKAQRKMNTKVRNMFGLK
jgi:hypothetical protein